MKSFKNFINEHDGVPGGEGHEHDGYGEHSHPYDAPTDVDPYDDYDDDYGNPFSPNFPWHEDNPYIDPTYLTVPDDDDDDDGIPNDQDPDHPDHPDYVPPGPFGPFYPNPSYPGDQQDPHYIV